MIQTRLNQRLALGLLALGLGAFYLWALHGRSSACVTFQSLDAQPDPPEWGRPKRPPELGQSKRPAGR